MFLPQSIRDKSRLLDELESITPMIDLESTTWIHGAEDCAHTTDPPIQVVAYDADTYILRQSKCVHFEGPFLYLLFGREKVLLHDTGATADPQRFPLAKKVKRLIEERQTQSGSSRRLLVSHSHGDSDHIQGDAQVRQLPNTTVAGTGVAAVRQFFGFTRWPEQTVTLDLGDRVLDVLATPGHTEDHIVLYDRQTGFLLTGDLLYPGHLFVRNWESYRASIPRLAEFCRTRTIRHVLGGHIEMTRQPRVDYQYRTVYQPDEHPLPLSVAHLNELEAALAAIGATPRYQVHDAFIIEPE